MLHTAELDMTDIVVSDDISDFLDDASWAICSTYHMVLKALSGAAIFGRGLLFDNPYMADWYKIGKHRHNQTDRNTACDNAKRGLISTMRLADRYRSEKMWDSPQK